MLSMSKCWFVCFLLLCIRYKSNNALCPRQISPRGQLSFTYLHKSYISKCCLNKMFFKCKKMVGCIEPWVKNHDTNRIVNWCIVTALLGTPKTFGDLWHLGGGDNYRKCVLTPISSHKWIANLFFNVWWYCQTSPNSSKTIFHIRICLPFWKMSKSIVDFHRPHIHETWHIWTSIWSKLSQKWLR